MTDESTNAAAAMPPYAKREPKRREFHGDVFEDDYEWMRDKDSDDVRSYVAAENQYCERRMAHLADFRHTLFEELKSHVEETDMSVPTRVNDYWYFTRTQQGKQYGVQCRIPVRDADDWDPPVVDPQGAPGSMPGEQVVFDANKESEGHDFFRLGGLDLSKDGRWMLYGVDVAGDERYDFRIRDLAGWRPGSRSANCPNSSPALAAHASRRTANGCSGWNWTIPGGRSLCGVIVLARRSNRMCACTEKPMNGSGWALASVLMSAIS